LFLQYVGTWYFLYHPANKQDEKLECPTNKLDVPVGNSSAFVIREYDKGYVQK